MSSERVVIHRADNDQFYYLHEAANGQVYETSETYTTLEHAQRAAHSANPDLPVVVAGDPPIEQP